MNFSIFKKINKEDVLKFLYLVALFFYLFTSYINITYAFYFEVLFYLIVLVYFLFSRKKIRFNSYTLWSFFMILISMIAFTNVLETFQPMIELRRILRIYITGFFIISFCESENDIYSLIKCLVYSSIGLFFYLIWITPQNLIFQARLGSSDLGFNANEVGLLFSISAIFSFYIYSNYKKLFYLIITIILSGGALLTGSRKSFLFVVVGIASLLFFNSNSSTKRIKNIAKIMIIFFVISYLVFEIPFLYEIIGIRIEALILTLIGKGMGDGSINIRRRMMSVGIDLFKNKPLFGWGFGSYSVLSGFRTYSHNNYVEILSSVGIVGFIVYYSLYLFIIIKLTYNRHINLCKLFLILMITMLIMEIGLVTYNTINHQLIIILAYTVTKLDKKRLFYGVF